jgi:hypothetical protein
MTKTCHRSRFVPALLAAATLAAVSAARPGTAAAEAGRSAVIVLLGDAGDSPELVALLTELLQRQDVAVRFERQRKLNTDELLAGKDDRAVRIFLELRGPREATLYFRSPRARRYMLRPLELRAGLDEVGRELVAQVVASSVDSLLRSSEGMTRSEMRAALARDRAAPAGPAPATPASASDASSPAPAAPPPAAATPPKSAPATGPSANKGSPAAPAPVPPAPSPPSRPSDAKLAPSPPAAATTVAATSRQPERGGGRWSAWVGARYTYSWGGPDLGPGHGPGVELGVQREGPTRLGARLSAERWFTQAVPTTNVDTALQSSPLCLLLDVGRPVSATQSLTLGVGGGVEITRVTPGMVYDPAVAATAPQQNVSPIARGELRYEMGGRTWRLAAVALADVSIYDTHYDVDRGGTTERAATPWRVRPGGALILGWRPTWGGK